MATKKLSFEESMKKLEDIVSHLEKGDLPLNESLSLFKEGTALVSKCNTMLDEAEQEVVALKKGTDRNPVESPFEDD